MKQFRFFIMAALLLLIAAPASAAGDFDWLRDLNIQAEGDPAGFRARLAARFKVGETQITTVLDNMRHPADAYMVFRMKELSRRPVERVVDEYKANKGRGWGVMAKGLGIKPGSKEFHALKSGHDLDRGQKKSKQKDRGKDKGKDKGKGGGPDKVDRGGGPDMDRDKSGGPGMDRGKGPGRS